MAQDQLEQKSHIDTASSRKPQNIHSQFPRATP